MGRRGRIVTIKAAVVCLALAISGVGGASAAEHAVASPGQRVASAAAASSAAPPTGAPIRIGTLGDNSSPNSSVSSPIHDGIVAWSQDVNASGGINGHPVELVDRDDQGDPTRSQALLRELVEEDGVIALVGTGGFSTDPTWVDYLEEREVPVVGGSGSTPPWSESPMFYPQMGSTVGRFFAYMRMAVLGGKTKGYVLYCAEVAACGSVLTVLETYQEAAGTELVGSAAVSATASDYNALCITMQQAGADYVALALPAATAIRVVQSCDGQNYRPMYTTSATNASEDFLGLPSAEGAAVLEVAFPPMADTAGAEAFRAAMAEYSPETSLSSSANLGWAAGKLFEAALRNAPEDREITTQDVFDGLHSLREETLDGLLAGGLTFAPDEPHGTFPCVYYSIVVDGELVPQDEPICAPEA